MAQWKDVARARVRDGGGRVVKNGGESVDRGTPTTTGSGPAATHNIILYYIIRREDVLQCNRPAVVSTSRRVLCNYEIMTTTTTTAFVYWDLLKREGILRGRTAVVSRRRQCGPRGYIRIRVGHRSKQSPHNGPRGKS